VGKRKATWELQGHAHTDAREKRKAKATREEKIGKEEKQQQQLSKTWGQTKTKTDTICRQNARDILWGEFRSVRSFVGSRVPNATERSGAEAAQNPTSAIKARGPQDSEHSIVVTRQDSLPAWKKDKPEKDLH